MPSSVILTIFISLIVNTSSDSLLKKPLLPSVDVYSPTFPKHSAKEIRLITFAISFI